MRDLLDRLNRLAEDFNRINPKWKSIVYTDKEKKEEFEALKNKMENCYLEAVQFIIKNSLDLDEFKEKASKIIGDKVFVSLSGKMKTIIEIFEDANLINGINDKAGFINDCFDKAIVRRDDNFVDDWEKYSFSSPREMGRAVGALSRLALIHVKVSFTKKTAGFEFKRITNLDDELCSIYAEKYENSYEKMQMKMILNSYSSIDKQIGALIDALTEK